MLKKFTWALLFCPLLLSAQEKGVFFVHGLSWEQIIDKAEKENKLIFVDCYATWCGPCKMMDKEVYPNDTVGEFMNSRFISVRMQMNKTKSDNNEVQDWYASAGSMEKEYSIDAYPSFLFFSSDGSILGKEVGAKSAGKFLDIVQAGMNSSWNSFAEALKKYKAGSLTYQEMKGLADTTKKIGMFKLAIGIANDYMSHYLVNLPASELWTKENILFIRDFSRSMHSSDKIFQLCLANRILIDTLMKRPGYSESMINYVIYSDEIKSTITSALSNHSEPNWAAIKQVIKNKYGQEFVEKNILIAKTEYYRQSEQWRKYARYLVLENEYGGIDKIARNGGPNIGVLNDIAYEVFKYSDRKKDLKKALFWATKALEKEQDAYDKAADMDTRANLLYRLGQQREGLALEAQAVSLKPRDKEILGNFEKMKNGQPTWVTN